MTLFSCPISLTFGFTLDPCLPKRPFARLLLSTNVSIFESKDLIGLPEYFRWGQNPGVFKINHTRKIELVDFASVAAIYLNLCGCK